MPSEKAIKNIRPLYDEYGAEGYYREFADEYQNPHFPEIRRLLEMNIPRLDVSGAILDLAAGGGEVTLILRECGVANVVGSDPWTSRLYEKQTGLPCLQWSFQDIIRSGLAQDFSSVICSFAMHLCPPKALFPLVWNIFQRTRQLIFITPHKRPALEQLEFVRLEWADEVFTPAGKRVRLKSYVPAE